MKAKKLDKLFYYNPNTLLLSTSKGLIRLHCPFMAKCMVHVGLNQTGDIITVTAIFLSVDKKLLYQVGKHKFSYDKFYVIWPLEVS